MSPRRNWDSSTPSTASECAPLPGAKGGGGAHSPAGEGLGESQFWRLETRAQHSAYSVIRPNHVATTQDVSVFDEFCLFPVLWIRIGFNADPDLGQVFVKVEFVHEKYPWK